MIPTTFRLHADHTPNHQERVLAAMPSAQVLPADVIAARAGLTLRQTRRALSGLAEANHVRYQTEAGGWNRLTETNVATRIVPDADFSLANLLGYPRGVLVGLTGRVYSPG